jgi:hypothetical protein
MLAEELQRVLEEFRGLDDEIQLLGDERKRMATLAHGLNRLLRSVVSLKAAERLIAELGLAEQLTRLPGLPGRKPAPPARQKRTTSRKASPSPRTETPEILDKGTAIRMLAGLYEGWVGIIRWISVKGTKITYAVALTGPEGKAARTEVTPRSFGKKWILSDKPPATKKPRKARKPAKSKAKRKKPARRAVAKKA